MLFIKNFGFLIEILDVDYLLCYNAIGIARWRGSDDKSQPF